MKLFGYTVIFNLMMVSAASAQFCQPIPEEVESFRGCTINTKVDHLAIRLMDTQKKASIVQSIYVAMDKYGLRRISENIYWYPQGRSCYLSWYGLESDNLVIVQSIKNVLVDQVRYCGIEMGKYDPVQLAESIEQELENRGLQDFVLTYFTNITVNTPIYDEILENGGTPGLMTLSDGELVTIDMQY